MSTDLIAEIKMRCLEIATINGTMGDMDYCINNAKKLAEFVLGQLSDTN